MQQGQHQINVDLKQAEDVGCEKCESLYFTPVIMVKKLSALISPTGQELKFPVQCFQCKECGHILEPPEAQ
jgi:uncharacterized OB-fold protein|tara:strand:- start:3935 stop:4147 length:213 start_codon:yes stop_codon:yes gene_type:complete